MNGRGRLIEEAGREVERGNVGEVVGASAEEKRGNAPLLPLRRRACPWALTRGWPEGPDEGAAPQGAFAPGPSPPHPTPA